MSTQNEAVVFPERDEVRIEVEDRPEPGAGELLIETRQSLISTGTELATLGGAFQRGTFPFESVGYSNVGSVVEAGDGVDEDWVGERVASPAPHARYVVQNAEMCQRVPEDVTDDEAAFQRLGAIAMNGVRKGRVEWGETVAVYGLGLVGQLAARFARVAGARTVVGFDVAEERLEYLPDADDVVGVNPASGAGDPVDLIEAAAGRRADAVIEATADVDAVPEECRVLRDRGRLVVLSSPREAGELDYYRHVHLPGHEIIGAHLSTHPSEATPADPWTVEAHHELFFDYADSGRVDLDGLVSHRFDYREAADAYRMLSEDRTRALGVVLEW